MKKLFLAFVICFSMQNAFAKNFFNEVGDNIKKAFTPSKFICDKYETQEYETMVLKPGLQLPFTEIHPKKRVCVKWENDTTSAIGKKCSQYEYRNTSKEKESTLYEKVKRKRTVCVEGHSTR